MTRLALLLPGTRGVKVILAVQLPPGAMGPLEHVSASAKSPSLATPMLLMVRGSGPVLTRVTALGALVTRKG
jgi:hypothetical protein